MIAPLLALAAQLALTPTSPDSASRAPAIVTRAPLDTGAPVNFRALVLPETVYVGQQATYQLGVFLDESVRDRLRRMEALAPEMRAMMAYDPPAPLSGFPRRTAGTRRYEAHVYQRAIFPLTAGRLAIPPARLVYAMPLSYSFFSREESFELRSDSVIVVAIEPPAAARPADYAGAVGTLRIDARLDTSTVRVGDPVMLTVRITGEGNVKLFPRPRLEAPWASAIPAGERVTLSPDSLTVCGFKEFDWVLTPLKAGRLTLPVLRYPYFDPVARRYQVAQTRAQMLIVAPGALATVDTPGAPARPRWAVRPAYRGALARPLYAHRPFWVVMLLAPIPAAALLATRRPRRRRIPSRASVLRALAHGRVERDGAREIRRVFLSAIGERLRVPAVLLAEPAGLARATRRAGTSAETTAAAAQLLAELNASAFSRDGAVVVNAAARAYQLYRAIDAEARPFRPPAGALLILIAFGAAAGAWALAPDRDAAQFARGVESYNRGHYAVAARDFADVAARVPRAPDAWANFGTAAYAAGDSAHAALGWQRALRLEPLASDVRDRLELFAPTTGTGLRAVPPLPPLPVALLAAALWLGGWLLLARRISRRSVPGGAPLALSAVCAALVLGASAALVDARLAARDLVVVGRATPLRLLPALASDRGASVRIGDVARVIERQGEWAHITADGDRDGWIEAAGVLSLARD